MSFGIVASVGVGLLGASASRSASKKAAASSDKATEAAEQSTAERLEFDKQQYADSAGDREFASGMARTQAANQAEDRTKYNALQDEQIVRGRRFQSAEDGMLRDAQNYDTEAKREQLAGMAMADANQGFASAREQQQRNLSRMGVAGNPSSGKAKAESNQMAIAQASGLAGAANGARLKAETTGRAMKMDALGLGKGMIGNQSTQAGLQLAAGNSAVSNAMVPFNMQQSAGNNMSSAFGNAGVGYNNLARTQVSGFNSAMNYGNSVGSSVGNVFGSILSKPGVIGGISNAFNFGSSGNNYNGSSVNSSAANYTNQYDLM